VRDVVRAVEKRLIEEMNGYLFVQVYADVVVGDVRVVDLGPELVDGGIVGGEEFLLVGSGHAVDEECEVLDEVVESGGLLGGGGRWVCSGGVGCSGVFSGGLERAGERKTVLLNGLISFQNIKAFF